VIETVGEIVARSPAVFSVAGNVVIALEVTTDAPSDGAVVPTVGPLNMIARTTEPEVAVSLDVNVEVDDP